MKGLCGCGCVCMGFVCLCAQCVLHYVRCCMYMRNVRVFVKGGWEVRGWGGGLGVEEKEGRVVNSSTSSRSTLSSQ